MEGTNTRTVGIAWYDRNEYPSARNAMTDAQSLPLDYDAWLRTAELVIMLEEARGSDVIRAPIHPTTFAAWCRATGQKPDIHARTRHVNLAVEDYCAAMRTIRADTFVEDADVEESASA